MRMCPQSEKKQTNKRIRSDATKKKQTKNPQKTKEKRGLSLDLWEPTNWDQNARLNQVNAASAGTAWNGARPRPLNAPTKPPIFVFFFCKNRSRNQTNPSMESSPTSYISIHYHSYLMYVSYLRYYLSHIHHWRIVIIRKKPFFLALEAIFHYSYLTYVSYLRYYLSHVFTFMIGEL